MMKQDNRVLGRRGARDLNTNELQLVQGAYIPHTNTACQLNALGQALNSPDSGPADGCPEITN